MKVSPCRSLFAASQKVATSQPGHGVFACLFIVPEGLGSESRWKWWDRGHTYCTVLSYRTVHTFEEKQEMAVSRCASFDMQALKHSHNNMTDSAQILDMNRGHVEKDSLHITFEMNHTLLLDRI